MDDKAFKSCPMCSVEALEEATVLKTKLILTAASAILLTIGLVFEFLLTWRVQALALFLAVTAVSGYRIIWKGLSSIVLRKRFNIDLLMTLAAASSFFIGHGEEGATVIFLFNIAEFLEEYAMERTRRSIHSLMSLAPEVTMVKRGEKEVAVHVHDVKVGEVIIIRPGEKIPLDGVVVRGVSTVNQAPITGESTPVVKQVEDEVYAGTINNEGFLEVRVTKPSDETVLSKIVKLVKEAQMGKTRAERFINRFTSYYTPSVLALAAAMTVIPVLVFGASLDVWLYRALVLVVVSCPCALAISTPVAMVSAITNAAKNGVLVKGGVYIEELNKAEVFMLDKTGTITEGRLEVSDIIELSGSKMETLLKAASLEALSEHPIARAVVRRAKEEGLRLRAVERFKTIPGRGVVGEIDGELYYVGSRGLAEEFSKHIPSEARRLENEGKTVVFVGNMREVIGLIALTDKLRDGVASTIKELKRRGVKTIMVTGDNERTAKAVANKIGVDEYRSRLLPDDKVKVVEEFSKKHGGVVMVGDGVNDAPALAKADVGVAMGIIGSGVSLETADVILMQDDPSKLPYLIELSRKTVKIVKENILASVTIKGVFTLLAPLGFISLWTAVAVGDMGLSLAVIFNAMRLSSVKSIRRA